VLIAGITGHICDSCITQAQNIIQEETQPAQPERDGGQPDPPAAGGHQALSLDEYVIGQDEAKKVLSVGGLQPLQAAAATSL
jgi:ATP-dependent Clp protease ATP-binding subunit ClpX